MRHLSSSMCFAAAVTVALGLAGCEDRTESSPYASRTTQAPESPPPPAPAPSLPAGGLPAAQPPPAPPTADATQLDDSQVAAVVVALNTGEIEEAKLARTRATSREVRKFADHMAQAHQAMLDHAHKDATASKITPSDNPVSDKLQRDVKQELTALGGLPAGEFDDTYVSDQIAAHQGALALIDQMMPGIDDKRMRSDLEHDRVKVDDHLKAAQKVQDDLRTGSTNMQGTSTLPR